MSPWDLRYLNFTLKRTIIVIIYSPLWNCKQKKSLLRFITIKKRASMLTLNIWIHSNRYWFFITSVISLISYNFKWKLGAAPMQFLKQALSKQHRDVLHLSLFKIWILGWTFKPKDWLKMNVPFSMALSPTIAMD